MRSALALVLVAACHHASPPSHDAAIGDPFWAWFVAHARDLRAGTPEDAMSSIQDELNRDGHHVLAEIGKDDPAWQLVISADGDRKLFAEVEALTAAAPAIDGWQIVAFRPRSHVAGQSVEMQGEKLAFDDIRIVATPDNGKLDLVVYLPGYHDGDDTLGQLAFIALDNAVGEKDTELRIGTLDFRALDQAPANAHPLVDLPKQLDALPP